MRRNARDLELEVPIALALTHFGIEIDADGRTHCPIHRGDNPTSFSVRGDRFRCFSCGAAGDVFDLVGAVRGVSFAEAYQMVAALAGGMSPPPGVSTPPHRLDRFDGGQRAGRRPRNPGEVLTRRRAALRRWRADRLDEAHRTLTLLRQRSKELAALLAQQYGDPWIVDRLLDHLQEILIAADNAQWCIARLEEWGHEDRWARMWLMERQSVEEPPIEGQDAAAHREIA